MTKPKKTDKANDGDHKSIRQLRAPREESLRHKEVFEIYYAMGDARSLRLLSEIANISMYTAELWSSTFGWGDRVQIRDQELIRRIQDDFKDEILRYRCFYIDLVKGMIQQCLTYDKDGKPTMSIKPTTVSDLDKLIKLHMQLMGDDGKPAGGDGGGSNSGGGTMNVQIVVPQQVEMGAWANMAQGKPQENARITVVNQNG